MASPRRIGLPLVAAAAVVLSAGITVSSLFAEGSLDLGVGGYGVCAPVRDGGILVGNSITNRGDEPLTLSSVRLERVRGVTLLESAILSGQPSIGVSNYPVQKSEIAEKGWDHREPVEGYVLDTGEEVELALAAGLTPETRKGSFTGYAIEYIDSSGVTRVAHSGDIELELRYLGECP